MEKNCTENKAALIAALIAIPSALFISMAVHHFVPVEEDFPRFTNEESLPRPKAPKGPRAPRTPGMKPGAKTPGAGERRTALLTLARQKAEVAERNLKLAQLQYKAKKAGMDEVILLTEKSLLARGALYRLENKIRTFRTSTSDIALRHETLKKLLTLAKNGKPGTLAAGKLEYELLDLAFQLQSSRLYSNEEWKKAYDAYCKTPGKENYLLMIRKEAEAMPGRRF